MDVDAQSPQTWNRVCVIFGYCQGKHQGLAPEVAQAELSSIGFKRVWGDEYFDPETERVWEAARLGVGTGLLPIWVDAICINQDDPEEKGHQVQMMHKIYSKAWLVLSWLGSASETKLDLALKTIRDLAPRTRDFPNVEWIEDFPELRVDDRERCEPDWVFPNPSWDAIRRFSDSDYFTRLWILPELWASQRCNLNLFICGEEHLHYNHLDEFQFWRARSRGTRDPLCAKIPWWGKYQSITPKFQIILGVVSAGKVKEEKLLDFLWFVGHCHCQDPRDKIFGLIEPFHMSVVPDYTMPVRDVWLNWAKDPSWNISPGKLLQISGSSLRSRPDVNYDLPSWLPDLTLLGEQLPSIGFSDHDDDVPDRFKPTISELNSVHCYGLPISTIREIVIQTPATFTSGVLPSKIRDVEFLKDISNLLRSIIEYLTGKKSPDPSHPCYDRNTQLWNLLQVLHMGERKPVEVEGKLERLSASYSKQIIISSFIEKLRSWTRHAASDSLEQIDHIISEFEKAWDSTKFPRDANNTTDLPHPKQGTPDYDLFFGLHVGAIHSARNQSFFHTTCGRLGTGPAGIQEQDRIFLIHGSSQPLVLREVNGEWTNVGACYVKGFADDDALEILANREDEVHSINIV